MTVEKLDSLGYDYQFGSQKWTKKEIEIMKQWHFWGKWVGQFFINGYWYKVFTK